MKKIYENKWFSYSIIFVSSFILAYYVGSLIGQSNIEFLNKWDAFFNVSFAFALVYYGQIIIHELGHYVFGRLTGYGFVSFRIASLVLYKDSEGYKIGRYTLPGTGGQCLLSPPEIGKDGKFPSILYNIGGGIFNILTALIAFLLYKNGNIEGFAGLIGIFTIGLGIYFAFINLLPLKIEGLGNDGYNAFLLSQKPDSLRNLWLQLKFNQLQTEGIRPGDMDEELFKLDPEEDLSNPLISTVWVMDIVREIDRKDFKKAKEKINFLLKEDLLAIHRYGLILELIYIKLIEGESIEELYTEEIQKYIKASRKYNPGTLRVVYTYELLENKDEEKAGKVLKQFEKLAKNHIYQGEIELERELIGLGQLAYKKEIGTYKET